MKISQQQFDDIQKKRANFSRVPPMQASTAQKVQALGRMKAGVMNKTEASYAARLELQKHTGNILWYKFEGITFKLADDTRYTPDFVVMLANGELEAHEVKGQWQDDAKVKIKVAASMFPMRFIAVKVRRKKDGGGWMVEDYS